MMTSWALPTPAVLDRWTSSVRGSAPSPAELRRTAMLRAPSASRVRTTVAALATTAAASVVGTGVASAQSSNASPSPTAVTEQIQSSSSDSDTDADGRPKVSKKKEPMLTQRPKALRNLPRHKSAHHKMVGGQSLWWLASDRLGPGASDAKIQAYLVEIWNANEKTIGTGDPNLVLSGTVLRLPPVKS